MRRDEGWLLAAIGAVLTAAVVSLAFVDSPSPGRTSSAPSQGRTSSAPSPSASPSPTPTVSVLVVSGARITTYAQGSKQLVVAVTVVGGHDPVLKAGGRLVVLRQVGDQVTGTLALDCAADVPELVLEVTDAEGVVQTRPLGTPRAAWSSACAAPLTGPGPRPSSSSRGS